MYTIGEFAALARVSVRMLRHYDAIELLVPARVDPRSGYRSYAIDQLPLLLRIVELRELGVGLIAVGRRGVRHRLPIVVGVDDSLELCIT